jgi:hypothetical protein
MPHLATHITAWVPTTEVGNYSFPIADCSLPHSIGYVRQILSMLKDNACRGCMGWGSRRESERHSRARNHRASDLSGHRKKTTNRGALTTQRL